MRDESELVLPSTPTLKGFQDYCLKMARIRNFVDETPKDAVLFLAEEVGELAKAIRKADGLRTDPNSKVGEIADEAADVFIVLLHLCNRTNVDLEAAFRTKEEKNRKREWK